MSRYRGSLYVTNLKKSRMRPTQTEIADVSRLCGEEKTIQCGVVAIKFLFRTISKGSVTGGKNKRNCESL